MSDDFDVHEFLDRHGEHLRQQHDAEVDLDRLQELNVVAVAAHPDRALLVEMMRRGRTFP